MKKKIVVLGAGFAGFRFLKKINLKKFDVIVVSPRNHFLFTPLLPSTTVGTIEFRSIIEPVRNIRGITFHQSSCVSLNDQMNTITCMDEDTQKKYEINYDYLVITVGEVTNTFGIEGVKNYSLFLKELSDARKIRTRVIDCFENASLPGLSSDEKRVFLRFVVCGGGPTGVEFAAELHDFIEADVKRKYSELAQFVEIVLIEAKNTLLTTFDKNLSEYTMKIFKRRNINLKTHTTVVKITKDIIYLNDGTKINYGLLVWSAGNAPADFVLNSGLKLSKKGKIVVNKFFQVKSKNRYCENIFAAGDCSFMEGIELPATAQVAQQSGLYLANLLNKNGKNKKQFEFRNLGMLAYIGGHRALADTPAIKSSGFGTFIFWRSAYLTKLVSFKNKILVIFDWTKTILFGRDISNF